MAVTLLTTAPRYIGTEIERASFAPDDIGAEYFESDTGLTYVFCGGTTWTLKLYPAPPSDDGNNGNGSGGGAS